MAVVLWFDPAEKNKSNKVHFEDKAINNMVKVIVFTILYVIREHDNDFIKINQKTRINGQVLE